MSTSLHPRNLNSARRSFILLGLLLAVGLFQFGLFDSVQGGRGLERRWESWEGNFNSIAASKGLSMDIWQDVPEKIPIMHTFYEAVPGGCCGMSQHGHEQLLEAWKNAWESLGWKTKVLNEEDAERHPEFWTIQERLKALDVNEYNRRCYWRWLAMASETGGGWMSDYDVIPLGLDAKKGLEISKTDNFRSYAQHVPSLIHASRAEWDRIIHLMMDLVPVTKSSHGIISDMYSLMTVREKLGKQSDMMIWTNEVEGGFPYTKNAEGWPWMKCKKLLRVKATHISHRATKDSFGWGNYPKLEDPPKDDHEAVEKRGEAAAAFMKQFNEKCLNKSNVN